MPTWKAKPELRRNHALVGGIAQNMHRGVLGHTIVHLKLSGPLIPRHVCLGFPSSSHMSFCAGTQAATSILSPKSGSEKEKIEMQREGMFSPLDELFYNKLPAGVRKREICGFQLTQKLKLEGSWEDLLSPTQSFVSVLVFLGKHSSLSRLHLLPSLVLTQPGLRALPESCSF